MPRASFEIRFPMTHPFVYLASQSPRRQELLRQLGVQYELLLPRPDEDAEALEAELPGESADAYVVRVCALKAHAARARLLNGKHANAPILVADTTVTIDGLILGKPLHEDDAVAMLERLAGREHEVLTAIAVVDGEGGAVRASKRRQGSNDEAATQKPAERCQRRGGRLDDEGHGQHRARDDCVPHRVSHGAPSIRVPCAAELVGR